MIQNWSKGFDMFHIIRMRLLLEHDLADSFLAIAIQACTQLPTSSRNPKLLKKKKGTRSVKTLWRLFVPLESFL